MSDNNCKICGNEPGKWIDCDALDWDGDPGVGLDYAPMCTHPDLDEDYEMDCLDAVASGGCPNGYTKCHECDALVKPKGKVDPKNPSTEVKKWIAKLRRVLKEMPSGLWLFNTGTMHVMAEGPEGPVMTKHGSYDQEYIVADMPLDVLSDGGDW